MREFGSEHPAIVLPDGYFKALQHFGREITFLRCGREALMYVSFNCKSGSEAVILCPAYSCWSMTAPFEKTGWKVVPYRLNPDLTVDVDYLRELLRTFRVEAILTMNFYGSASTKEAVTLVKAHHEGIVVIEDFSHCTFCLDQIFDERVDYYVSSVRKSIGVCDGAVVLSKQATNREYIQHEVTDFAEERFEAQVQKGRYAYHKKQEVKSHFLTALRRGEEIIDDFDTVRPMSKRSELMLDIVNGAEIAFARRENMKHLWRLLQGKVELIPGLERSFQGAPFSLPVLVENRDEVQRQMAQRGLYAPVLWPISEEARQVCKVSARMADRMLSIPIDQRYVYDDIEEMASIILTTIQ